ncbi:hypothetical protein ACFODO_05820 [Acinetobacter sichuanensis]|uniref:Uncharacterized protein n=1 Tax=Acinetobacter sichuanensis TaxID=2136183 RepID=A0A371YS88_9GAMM|nr:hypothetical protein [Acinetobacter sichuanensis]RFC84337.1 hypothetical protein C9E89_006605 [Acinetobacter sichuanensis]
MIQPNWEIFSAKFSNNQQVTFEWFAYLLFCREFDLPKGWFGFKNQSGIEKNPIEKDGEVIGFQAKFYSTTLSAHKDDFLEMLEKAKRDHANLTKILVYTNQFWGQAYSRSDKKMTSPQALIDIESKAKEFNIELVWREASFFESEFVGLEHSDLAKYFFTETNLEGWQRYDDWSNTKAELESEYLVDDDIKVIIPKDTSNTEHNVVDGINAIREKLSNSGNSVRLVGLSGVGKTRLAQALFDERIGTNSLDVRSAWYCDIGDSPNPLPEHFVEELVQNKRHDILIVDNCGQNTHDKLTRKIKDTEISLLTIEYDVKDDLPERTNVYKLQPNSTDIIKKVIERHFSNINDLNARKIAEFSGGNYRLALAIASNIERTDNLALLTSSELFERLFWQRGQRNDDLYRVAQNFALVYSFNIEDSGEENSELDYISNFARIDNYDAIERIEELKNKDIVQQRGKWRAILPHVLANHLAKECISKRLVNHLDNFIRNMPSRLQTSCIKRLSYLHDIPKVQELVRLWFSPNGWLGEKLLNDEYDAQDLVKFRLLAHIAEEQLLQLMEQKNNANPNFLTRDNLHFVELSRLIQSLAYEPQNFRKAFELLIYFAKDEKEGERNSSIRDLVTSLFRLYTSETLANLELKKEILTELKEYEEYQSILLACISKALNFHEYGYILRDFDASGRSSDYGYQPKTYGEIWEWIEFLLGLLSELDFYQTEQVREILTNHLKEIIWTCGDFEIVRKYLLEFNSRQYFPEIHRQILNIIKFHNDELKVNAPQLLQELESLEQELRPKKDNIRELIQVYILAPDHDLYRLSKGENDEHAIKIPEFNCYEELIEYLVENFKNVDILTENLDLLIKASSGWLAHPYLIRLGENAASVFESVDSCIAAIQCTQINANIKNSEFLLGLLKAFNQSSRNDYQKLINFLLSHTVLRNIIPHMIFGSCQSDEDFQYYYQLFNQNRIDSTQLLRLAGCKYHNRIDNEIFELFLDTLIEKKHWQSVYYELLEECFFQKKLAKKYQPILLNHIPELVSNENNFDHFEDGLNVLLGCGNNFQDKIFNDVKEFFSTQSYLSLYREDKKFKILKLLIENNTTKFIIHFIEDKDFLRKFWKGDLDKVLIYANPNEVLAWTKQDQEKIKFWIENARLFSIESLQDKCNEESKIKVVWCDLILDLFKRSTEKEALLEGLFENSIFDVRQASGSWSEEMSRRLPSIKALKEKFESVFPELLSIINDKEQKWLIAIDKQAQQDTEREKQRSERFEW